MRPRKMPETEPATPVGSIGTEDQCWEQSFRQMTESVDRNRDRRQELRMETGGADR